MIHFIKTKTVVVLLLFSVAAWGQTNPQNACRIVNNRLVFTYNLNWSNDQKKQFVELFDIDSLTLVNSTKGIPKFTVDGVVWNSKKVSPNIIEFSKPLNEGISVQQSVDKISLSSTVGNTETIFAEYGVNKFDAPSCFRYSNGIATFFLPKNLNAKKVLISGSFNGWSTMQAPMQKTDSGWVINIKLQPGKYLYKYIVDGLWAHDQNNKIKERNEHSSYNSVVFCYNYTFTLNAYPNARKVILSGSFNGWNKAELPMIRVANGWELPLFIKEGTHAYKFIVDNSWILDPNSKTSRPDGRGNVNSFIGIGPIHTFKLKGFLTAKNVFVAGNFNAWNGGELLMQKTSDGWILPYNLGKGNYEYKFIVDDKWISDPDNPTTIGNNNHTNSLLSISPNHTFKVNRFNQAKSVIVTGSFNGWSHDGYKMRKTAEGWALSLYLKPGKYTYKLIVDGKWILDPENKLWEQNEFGNGNSVLWVNY